MWKTAFYKFSYSYKPIGCGLNGQILGASGTFCGAQLRTNSQQDNRQRYSFFAVADVLQFHSAA
jgi:hypothetical protein